MPGQYPPTPNHVQSNLPAQGHTLPPGVAVDHIRSLAYGSPQPPVYAQPIHYTYPYTSVPSATTTSPRSPQVQSPTYTHRTQTQQPPTPRSRQSDQVLMIPASQVTPDQMEQLQLQFPELRLKVKKKRRRHRDGQGAETDREDRGRARAGTDADQFRNHAPAGGGRPRSTSVPAQAQTEEERDGPRNLVELMAKYEPRRRRHRDVVTINVGGGDGNRPVKVDSGAGHTRTENASRGGHERRASEIRGPRPRAVDGGVSIMGGPIRRNPQ
ncbi:hypothetical protein BN14_08677 [Rhizoctonia solani AG-1 IB]|uniref:Uncharacterized protein n=1 Tax=Thanatephorus cucumeris (strain AG1-IB / isolate 7/3/14) TaxID=1108050 RepID=M5C5I8_THACB|nr:hypothetical protein BN14_08677 [Rhizoctonia solani AG-1 IB]